MSETRQIENTRRDFGIKQLLIHLASVFFFPCVFLLPPPPPPPSPQPSPPIGPRLMIYGEFLSAEAATKPSGVFNRRSGDIPALNIHYRAPELCALQKATPPAPHSLHPPPAFIYLFIYLKICLFLLSSPSAFLFFF